MGHPAVNLDKNSDFEVVKDWNGIDQIVLKVPSGASVRVSLHGGQVVSWRNEKGEELLFTSSKKFGTYIKLVSWKEVYSVKSQQEWKSILDDKIDFSQGYTDRKAIFKPPKAMRGGIPICFPQFGNCGSLEQHGFARNRIWSIENDPPPLNTNSKFESGKATINLLLKPTDDDLKSWPHCFEFRLRICLFMDGHLCMTSRVRNVNGKPFSFSFAYHTYLSVSDIRSEVRIEGLETLDYLDNLSQRERFTEQGDAITFESEVDRIYVGSPTVIAVLDHEKKRTFLIRKEGLPDTVVWNPWEKKSRSMMDLGDEEYKQMLCVDAAAIEKPITLKPNEEWTGRLELSSVPSTCCHDHLD